MTGGRPRVAVVDVDCLVAGVLTPTGASSELIQRWRDGEIEIVASPLLLSELRRTLDKPHITRRYADVLWRADRLVDELGKDALSVPDPDDPNRYVPRDPEDDYLVALALAAGADCLVTRDSHFEGVEVPGVRIVTPGRIGRELRGDD